MHIYMLTPDNTLSRLNHMWWLSADSAPSARCSYALLCHQKCVPHSLSSAGFSLPQFVRQPHAPAPRSAVLHHPLLWLPAAPHSLSCPFFSGPCSLQQSLPTRLFSSLGVRCCLSISISVPVPVSVSVSLFLSFCRVSCVLCLVCCVCVFVVCLRLSVSLTVSCVLCLVSCVWCMCLCLCLSLCLCIFCNLRLRLFLCLFLCLF